MHGEIIFHTNFSIKSCDVEGFNLDLSDNYRQNAFVSDYAITSPALYM